MIYNPDAEQSVLGAVLLDNDAFDRIGELSADDFYVGANKTVYSEILKLTHTNTPIDVITLAERLSDVPMSYLHDLTANTPSSANIGRYAQIVRECAQRRRLSQLAANLTEWSKETTKPEEIINSAQTALEDIAQCTHRNEPILVNDDLQRYLTELQNRAEGEGPKAIPTGFVDLDKKMMGGMRRGELWILAARPKMGKTAMALNIALNAAKDHSVLILSMEMPRDQLHDRNMAVLGHIDLPKVIDPRTMDQDDWSSLTHALTKIQDMKFYMDDQGGLTFHDVRIKARQVKRKSGLDLMVIDYLQLMNGDGDNRNAQIEQITRGLKALAKEMDMAILLLSQLNRGLEQRPNKRPMPSDLRDSGAIEQDCDGAIFLYRDEVYNPDTMDKGICEANIGLIRQGEPGTVGLTYIGKQTRFESLMQGYEFGRAPVKQKSSRFSLVD